VLAKLRARLTYANVVATLALFVALGGSSYAAITITGKDVKNSSLTGKDIKNSSLTTSDVKNRSLLAQDFKAGQLPAGPKGATGDIGPRGPVGPSTGPAGGVLAGTYPSPGFQASVNSVIPAAVVLIGGDGGVASEAHRAPITGPPSVDHTVQGIYTLSFPGLALGGDDAPLCTLRGLGSSGEISAFTGGAGTLSVYVWNSSGAGVNQSFQCAVYHL
jgi:hypothetical protein